MNAPEPSLATLPSAPLRLVLATRPAFLSVTLFAVLIGLAAAYRDGVAIHAGTALATLLFALVAHAGINVFNDYYDALNGTDAINTERLFPFTGGSRFIQNGVLTTGATARFALALFTVVVAAGLWLTAVSAPGLVAIGIAGLVIGWGYSAPPLKLVSRGWGEPCVWAGFALIAAGSDFVQRGGFSAAPLVAATPYALLVANILFINEFPDRRADEAVGKRTWVVRLGPRRARSVYAAVVIGANAWLAGAVALGALPLSALSAMLAAVPSVQAAWRLHRHAEAPAALAPAIKATIAAACLQGALLAGALLLAGPR